MFVVIARLASGGKMSDLPKYEYLETSAVKGFESKTKKKYLDDGWELVSEEKKSLRTLLKFRRQKKPLSTKIIAIAAAGALAMAAIITVGSLTEDKTPSHNDASNTQEQIKEDDQAASVDEKSKEGDVLTIENTPELKRLLTDKNEDTRFWQEFWDKHKMSEIEFDGNVAFMTNTPGYQYTVDCLIEAGNYSETTAIGPPFRAPMINIHTGFKVQNSGERSTLFQGDNIHIVARLVDYNPVGQTFEIDILSTTVR